MTTIVREAVALYLTLSVEYRVEYLSVEYLVLFVIVGIPPAIMVIFAVLIIRLHIIAWFEVPTYPTAIRTNTDSIPFSLSDPVSYRINMRVPADEADGVFRYYQSHFIKQGWTKTPNEYYDNWYQKENRQMKVSLGAWLWNDMSKNNCSVSGICQGDPAFKEINIVSKWWPVLTALELEQAASIVP